MNRIDETEHEELAAIKRDLGDKRMGELTELERIFVAILWMVENEGYGINGAADDLIARIKRYRF